MSSSSIMAHPTMSQIEAITAEIDRQLVTYKDRTIISNTEFINALLDVRIIADAFWVTAIPQDSANLFRFDELGTP